MVTNGVGFKQHTRTKTITDYIAPKDALVDLSKTHNAQLSYISCDVTSAPSVEAAFHQADAASRYPLRGLVTCAGISAKGPAVDFPVDSFRRIMDINVTGNFLCAREAAKVFHSRGVAGSIVMLASMSGTVYNRVSLQSSCVVS